MISRLYFITGSSGIGKSTLVPVLQKILSKHYVVYDFDEKLTKEAALDGKLLDTWRNETTSYWINEAMRNKKAGSSTIVVGLIYPAEALKMKLKIPISICLLDASSEKIKKQLMRFRFSTPERIAGLKQGTGKTPEEFIEENEQTMEQLRQETKSASGFVINTTNDTPEKTAEKVVSWIESQ